jgi:hypothetical protein
MLIEPSTDSDYSARPALDKMFVGRTAVREANAGRQRRRDAFRP